MTTVLAGCAGAAPRPADSSLSCMQTVRGAVPAGLSSDRAHCLAAGEIALRCSVIEAQLAGLGKKLSDLFGGGDASTRDWKADLAGIRCASDDARDGDLDACCAASGF